MHHDQIDLSLATADRLIREQFPDLTGELQMVPSAGTENAIVRIGDGYAARFPLRHEDPAEVHARLVREQTAITELAAVSPVPTPRAIGLGRPGHGYPLTWSAQTWVAGTDAFGADMSNDAFTDDLVALLTTLRAVDTHGRTFQGPNRGGVLLHHDAWVRTCLDGMAAVVDAATLAELADMWDHFRDLPEAPGPDVMSHRDLVPGNVLVAPGPGGTRLVGLLDGGGYSPADRSLDLVAAWHLLEHPHQRVRLRAALACDDLEWQRGRAWAFEQAIGLPWYYRDSNPTAAALGLRTLSRLRAE